MPSPRQHLGYRTFPQDGQVVDAVGAGERPGDDGGDFRRGVGAGIAGDFTRVVTRCGRPARRASRIAGTSPADLLRLGSSKVAATFGIWDSRIADGFLFRIMGDSETHHFPRSGAIRPHLSHHSTTIYKADPGRVETSIDIWPSHALAAGS